MAIAGGFQSLGLQPFPLENSRNLKPGRARKRISLDTHTNFSHDSDRCEIVVLRSGQDSTQLQNVESKTNESGCRFRRESLTLHRWADHPEQSHLGRERRVHLTAKSW